MKHRKYQLLRLLFALIFLVIFVLLAANLAPRINFLAQLQFIPSFLSAIVEFSISSALIFGAWLVFTRLTGRWYCAFFCPLGTVIDLLDLISFPGKKAVKKDCSSLQRIIALACFALALCGVNYGFMLLDPYSNFLAAASIFALDFNIRTLVPLILILILALWKRRLFCTAICPAGGCFNLLSRNCTLKLELKENCVKCRKCEKSCPAGCIDVDSGKIDNARCIRCLNCFSQCRISALGFNFSSSRTTQEKSPERREFIKRSSIAIGGAVAGGIMIKLGMEKFAPIQPFSQILPPGAGDIKRFTEKCTACLICAANCPADIIRPASGGDGPVSLDLSKNFCQWDCTMCSDCCPTGAIEELNLSEKQHTQIANAIISTKCIGCTKCVSECPAHAISINAQNRAEADLKRCVGCGKCTSLCPVKAISIAPVAKQIRLEEIPLQEENSPPSDDDTTKKASINTKECFSCGSCAEVCPVKAITLDENNTPKPVDQTKCIGCGKCITSCPAHAIILK